MTWDFECSVCHTDKTVLPVGPKSSPILIIGDKPGKQELDEGKCYVGPTGGVLRAELSKLGVDMKTIRITNLWLHEPNGKKECQDHYATKAIAEAKGKKVILLIGSETAKYFCGCSVEGYNGLEVKSDWFPEARVMVSVQPSMVFHNSLGEVRFALSEFAMLLKKEGLA